MKSAFALAAFAGLALAAPQASSAAAAPLASAPAGCDATYMNGANFEITIVKPSNLKKRQDSSCGQTGILTLNLKNGNLMDIDGRTGYIASANQQFQFDKPVQAGGIYEGQFSVCKNGSIALGPTTQFFQCASGGFGNLYYANIAPQCEAVNIDIIPCDSSSSSSSAAAPSTMVSAAAVTSAKPVSVSSDGQPQGTAKPTSVIPVSVYTDGQPQATNKPTSVMKPAPVSVFTDGQPQVTAAVTAMSNATVATAKPTIATGSGSTVAASGAMAGLLAAFALLF